MDIESISAKVDATTWQVYAEAMQSVLTEYMAETELPNQRCVARAMSRQRAVSHEPAMHQAGERAAHVG